MNDLADFPRPIRRHGGKYPYRRARLPLTALVTTHEAMTEVLASGRVSDTPGEPILVTARHDLGRWEIADGHHRVAAIIRAGGTHVDAALDDGEDDEPYEPPYYNFGR